MRKLIIATIIITVFACSQAFAEVTAGDFTYFTHFAIGVAWDVNDFDDHSIAFISAITYKDTFNLDIGLIDFEQVQADGELWWHDLNPVVGISADVVKLGELLPVLAPLLEWVPEWVGIGAGFYCELDNLTDLDDVDGIVYATISWEW